MAKTTGMWIATHTFDTRYGTVNMGRIVADGDPLLDEQAPPVFAAPGDPEPQPRWVRVVLEPTPIGEPSPVIEEATANPGERRPTRRKA